MGIQTIVENYKNQYGDRVETRSPLTEFKNIPKVLWEFYAYSNGIQLPFGIIYTKNVALEKSQRSPFLSDWFVFGFDGYFTFWLCRFDPDLESLSITTWDHESGNIIEDAIWKNLEEFIVEIHEEWEEENPS